MKKSVTDVILQYERRRRFSRPCHTYNLDEMERKFGKQLDSMIDRLRKNGAGSLRKEDILLFLDASYKAPFQEIIVFTKDYVVGTEFSKAISLYGIKRVEEKTKFGGAEEWLFDYGRTKEKIRLKKSYTVNFREVLDELRGYEEEDRKIKTFQEMHKEAVQLFNKKEYSAFVKQLEQLYELGDVEAGEALAAQYLLNPEMKNEKLACQWAKKITKTSFSGYGHYLLSHMKLKENDVSEAYFQMSRAHQFADLRVEKDLLKLRELRQKQKLERTGYRYGALIQDVNAISFIMESVSAEFYIEFLKKYGASEEEIERWSASNTKKMMDHQRGASEDSTFERIYSNFMKNLPSINYDGRDSRDKKHVILPQLIKQSRDLDRFLLEYTEKNEFFFHHIPHFTSGLTLASDEFKIKLVIAERYREVMSEDPFCHLTKNSQYENAFYRMQDYKNSSNMIKDKTLQLASLKSVIDNYEQAMAVHKRTVTPVFAFYYVYNQRSNQDSDIKQKFDQWLDSLILKILWYDAEVLRMKRELLKKYGIREYEFNNNAVKGEEKRMQMMDELYAMNAEKNESWYRDSNAFECFNMNPASCRHILSRLNSFKNKTYRLEDVMLSSFYEKSDYYGEIVVTKDGVLCSDMLERDVSMKNLLCMKELKGSRLLLTYTDLHTEEVKLRDYIRNQSYIIDVLNQLAVYF